MKALTSWLVILCTMHATSYAQPGTNDPTFNMSDDCTFGQGESFSFDVHTTAIQPDDKVIAGGSFTDYNGTPRSKIARLNTDGSLDHSFDPGTGFNFDVHALIIQPDGKIVAGGFFTYYNAASAIRIVRINSDGSIDPTFNIGSGFNSVVRALQLQPDGKIIAAGNFTSFNGTPVNRIARLNADGTLDTSFDPQGGFDAEVLTISQQPDGKIVAGGEFTSFNGNTSNRIARVDINGVFDPSFATGAGFNGDIFSALVQPDGKILAGGYFSSYNGNSINNIVRLNSDGTLDGTFVLGGSGPSSTVMCLAIQPDLKILIGGEFDHYNGVRSAGIICVNVDGSLDNTFSADTLHYGFSAISIRDDQKIVGGGTFHSYNYITRNYILCLESDGLLDWTFNPGIGFNEEAKVACVQPDDKIIFGGYFNTYNGVAASAIVRLNSDGTLDSSFDPGSGCETPGFFGSYVSTIVVQPDDKILIGGYFHTYQGISRNCIARLNPDGSLDSSFDPGTGFPTDVTSISLQPDGKMIVTGFFTSFNGTSANRIVRLNGDGSIDPSFNTGSGFNNTVATLFIQSDDKIIVAGSFTSYDGITKNRIVRLNSDGSIDPGFITGTGFNSSVYTIDVMDDGRIVAGGNFTTFNGITRTRIAVLNSDGSLDLTFNPSGGFNDQVGRLLILPDGDILTCGNYTSYNSSTQNYIARLNPDGSLELAFNSGTGFNDIVRSVTLQNDSQIIACGLFTEYNGECRTRLTRMQNECLNTSATIAPVSCGSHTENGITYASSGTYTQIIPNSAWCDSVLTINLTIISEPDSSEITAIACGSFTENGQTYNSSGIYIQTIPAMSGICDSVVIINLSILNSDSTLTVTSCGPHSENGTTYSTSGIYTQVIPNSFGCDSTITIDLTVIEIDVTVLQTQTTMESIETGSAFQWLDCNEGSDIPSATSDIFTANTLGNFAVVITKNGCTDTSDCIIIESQDFYDLPGYTTLSAEVFAYPVSSIDTCDAIALTNCMGGIAPYTFDWLTQVNNQNSNIVDSLCEGIHTLKITDQISDSLLIDYYITDSANFFTWYDLTTTFIDTVYTAASNCGIDYSIPLDSAFINDFYYISPTSVPGVDFYYIEIAYYQAGLAYYNTDTLSMDDDGWYLINFSVYCPTKNFSQIKTLLLDMNYPIVLGYKEKLIAVSPSIYPNPTNGVLTISGIPENCTIYITTINGEIIQTERPEVTSAIMNIGNFPAGPYIVRICEENGSIYNMILLKK